MKQFIKDNTEVLPKINRDITMNDNIKTSFGLLFPFSSIALFVYFCIIGSFLAAILAAVGGVMFWYLYSVVMESEMPDITGNMIVLLGGMLSVGFFLNYGVTKNMFGGFNINLEGATASAVVLFFSVLLGINLRSHPANSIKPDTLETPISSSAEPSTPAELDKFDVSNDLSSDVYDENYSYYDPSEYEYPDDYDYEHDDEGYELYEEE